MNRIDKTNRFKNFRNKHRKDDSVNELLDYICLLEDQIEQLEKMVIAIEKNLISEDELHG